MEKFKIVLFKTINVLATVVLISSTALSMLGLISVADMPWLNDLLPQFLVNMSLTETVTTSLGLGGVAGGIGAFRVASKEVKRITSLDKERNERRIDNLEKEFNMRMDKLEESNADFITEVVYLMNSNTEAITELNKHLQNLENFNLITARRNSKLKVVSKEDKELYKEYINSAASNKPFRAKRLNVTINKIVEEDKHNELTEEVEDLETKNLEWKL